MGDVEITQDEKDYFDALRVGCGQQKAFLIQAKRRDNGKVVALICLQVDTPHGEATLPIAEMVGKDVTLLYCLPGPDGTFDESGAHWQEGPESTVTVGKLE